MSLSSSFRTLNPHMMIAKPTNVLGEKIKLHIYVQGCRGLPSRSCIAPNSSYHSYRVEISAVSDSIYGPSRIMSKDAQPGDGSRHVALQWNEILCVECFELSCISVVIWAQTDDHRCWGIYGASLLATDILRSSELRLWPSEAESEPSSYSCLNISATRVSIGHEEQTYALNERPCRIFNPEEPLYANLSRARWPLAKILLQFPVVLATANQSKISTYHMRQIQQHVFEMYMQFTDTLTLYASGDVLLSAIITTFDAMSQAPATRMQLRRECIENILGEIFSTVITLKGYMLRCAPCHPKYDHDDEAELARLTWLLVTPNPIAEISRTPTNTDRRTIFGNTEKDALLFVLESITRCAGMFPPLKCAADALLSFVQHAEIICGNKRQIRDICRRIDGLAACIKRGVQDGSPLSPAHQEAITTLTHDIGLMNEDLEGIANERRNRFKRYFSAKRHREELQMVMNQLETARANYMMTVATLNATTSTRVLAHVQTLIFVLGIDPGYSMPGTHRADAVVFPSGPSRIEQA